jgi:hypothetical protein
MIRKTIFAVATVAALGAAALIPTEASAGGGGKGGGGFTAAAFTVMGATVTFLSLSWELSNA